MFDRDWCDGADLFSLITYAFVAGATTCFLFALHRIAAALKLTARAKALSAAGGEMDADDRAKLVRKIAAQAQRYA